MSITDELRKWISTVTWLDDGMSHSYKNILAIADRIDAEHEWLMDEQYKSLTVDMKPMTDENMAADGWIRLPKDADGVTWHLGDRDEDGRMVTAIKLCFDGFWIRVGCTYRIAKQALHYHAPTVEDVLREFGDWYAHTKGGCDEDGIITEYAKRLTLAEGEDA